MSVTTKPSNEIIYFLGAANFALKTQYKFCFILFIWITMHVTEI